MKIVPISKFEYKLYPIRQDDRFIEISAEDFNGLENKTKCFNNSLTSVIDYVKTTAETAAEVAAEQRTATLTRISELKRNLVESDYKVLKHTEGCLSDEEYNAAKAERQAWRDEINALESELSEGGAV